MNHNNHTHSNMLPQQYNRLPVTLLFLRLLKFYNPEIKIIIKIIKRRINCGWNSEIIWFEFGKNQRRPGEIVVPEMF